MTVATATVAKKKAPNPRDDWDRKPLVLQMRGSLEWKAWLERAADFYRTTVASLVDQAVAEYSRNHGFTEPPPKR